jgi:hypothetical protein
MLRIRWHGLLMKFMTHITEAGEVNPEIENILDLF